MNLNNTPSAGTLTEADMLNPWRRTGSRAGVEPQEQPQPAEASTELGADDSLACARGVVIAVPASLLAWAVISAGAVTVKFWPQIAAFLGLGPTT